MTVFTNGWTHSWLTAEFMHEWKNEWMNAGIKLMNRWLYFQMDVRMAVECMHEWKKIGLINGRMIDWMN